MAPAASRPGVSRLAVASCSSSNASRSLKLLFYMLDASRGDAVREEASIQEFRAHQQTEP